MLAFLLLLPLFVQANATLEVIVKDPSGALINKAQVQLVKNGKPQSLVQTNQRGEAHFSKIAPGRYELRIEAAGFKARDLNELDLTAGANRQEEIGRASCKEKCRSRW